MRGFAKVAVLSVGILAALLGIWWVCQGTGLVPVGFMAHQMTWAYRGAVLFLFRAGLAVLSRRI
jgi:hypothetical protein